MQVLQVETGMFHDAQSISQEVDLQNTIGYLKIDMLVEYKLLVLSLDIGSCSERVSQEIKCPGQASCFKNICGWQKSSGE